MPTTYECNSCGLILEFGWYHYHSFSSGYGASTLVGCLACGCQHRVEIAMRDRGPEFLHDYDVLLTAVSAEQRLQVMTQLRKDLAISLSQAQSAVNRLPFVIKRALDCCEARTLEKTYRGVGAVIEMKVVTSKANPDFGPIQQDRLLRCTSLRFRSDGAKPEFTPTGVRNRDNSLAGEFRLDEQACGLCGCIGDLVSGLSEPHSPCPNCKSGRLAETGGWVT